MLDSVLRMDTLAVFQTGGKQYLVHEGDTVLLEKIEAEEGKPLQFEEVFLTSTGKTTQVGTPTVKGAKVTAELVEQGRHDKVIGVKMKAKKRNKQYFGHKQPYTKIKITKIATK